MFSGVVFVACIRNCIVRQGLVRSLIRVNRMWWNRMGRMMRDEEVRTSEETVSWLIFRISARDEQ